MALSNFGSQPPKSQGYTDAAVQSVDPAVAIIHAFSPNQAQTINLTGPGNPGDIIVLQFNTINTTDRAMTFGAYLRSTGVLQTGTTAARRFNVTFMSDGLVFSEIARTAAQA
jgi:hypothetical protein